MKNPGISNGLYLGIALVVISLVFYLVNSSLLFNMWLNLIIGLVLYVFFMRNAGLQERSQNNGFISFKGALKPTFLTYVIGTLIAVLFSYVLFNVIDPGLIEVLKETSIESAEKMARMFGADDAAVEEAIARIEESDMSMSLRRLAIQYLSGLILGFIIALIISAVIKRKPEIEETA